MTELPIDVPHNFEIFLELEEILSAKRSEQNQRKQKKKAEGIHREKSILDFPSLVKFSLTRGVGMTDHFLLTLISAAFIGHQAVDSNASMIKIAVGSTNPIKIQAVRNALSNGSMQLISCSASSNVRPQPLSDDETLQGAINRARHSLVQTDSFLAIGLEAGVVFLHDEVYLCHWAALVDRDHKTYSTNGPLILLPKDYTQDLVKGKNLDEIMHERTGIENLGSKQGAVGFFTNNNLDREQMLTQMVRVLLGQYNHYQAKK